jgi:REP element-mobilizing transposase RayT
MKNHFHLLVRIKDKEEINNSIANPDRVRNPVRVGKTERFKKVKQPYRYFSDFFNAYTQAFNKVHKRHGGLFETPFQRIEVDNNSYFRHLVCYIHQNPVKHGFTDMMVDYPWSSYLSIISVSKTNLKKDKVVGWFNSQADFIEFHNKEQNFESIKNIILE